MRMINGSDRILSGIALAMSISLGSCHTAQSLFHPPKHSSRASSNMESQAAANGETFPCYHPKEQAPEDRSSRHSVSVSWKASVSLSMPPVAGEGYNLYRLNPDGSCTKVNGALIGGTVYEDWFVEPGKTYRYAAKAFKQNSESGLSDVVEVSVPPN